MEPSSTDGVRRGRRGAGAVNSTTRTQLLDAAERVMADEGYSAVTSRRVALEAGVNQGLVYYYFGLMDDLYLAMFHRRAQRIYERTAAALSSDQPLWALWEVAINHGNPDLNFEFLALGNHSKDFREQVRSWAINFRQMQLDGVSRALDRYGVDQERWPAKSVVLFIFGSARFLLTDLAYDLDFGHPEAIGVVERLIRELEGERLRPEAR